MKRLLIIVCTTAGQATQITEPIAELLSAASVRYKIITIRIPPDLPKVIKKLALQSYDAVAVYGGDGTVVAAIKAFEPHNLPLIVLPGGTANVIANYLNMPADPLEGIKTYLENRYVKDLVDIAYVGDDPLVLDMHMGLWTEAITNTSRKLKRRIGSAAYGWSTLMQVAKAEKQTYAFKLDSRPAQKVQGYTLLVVNQGNHKILGLPLFPHEHAPGMVQLAIVKRVRIDRLIAWYVYRLITGRNLRSVIETHRAHKIRLLRSPNLALADDTEQKLHLPLTITGTTKHVRVIVPPPIPETTWYKRWWRRFGLWRVRTKQHIGIFTSQHPELRYSHVAPGIYLGGKVSSRVFGTLRQWGITGIISMRTSKPPATPKDIETLWLPTTDWTPPTLDAFASGVAFIKRKLKTNGAVYIHCQLGEGRGPSMAAAYLIDQGFTVEEAIARLVKYRPMVRPNAAQRKRLAEWQELCAQRLVR